ncbi:MAG TPA: Clp protease N-terminal domain-containing protein [Bryobacteraceae bacterium]|nr:Clp protease N-terminal domain-containing protein [Bryobacteraceae bacterium]
MFERFDERARRAVFFARYEASQAGSAEIECHHLLLALFREGWAVFGPFLKSRERAAAIRKEIEARFPPRPRVSTSVEIPLSAEFKRALACASEESERLGQNWIGPVHIVLGLLREPSGAVAEILVRNGMGLEDVRAVAAAMLPPSDRERRGAWVRWSPVNRPEKDVFTELPLDRLDGAFRILEAIAREKVRVEVTSPEGSFTLSYGSEGGKPAS